MKLIKALRNEKQTAVRVAFQIDGDYFVVVKIFVGGNLASIKFWTGKSFEYVSSFWNTKEEVTNIYELRDYQRMALEEYRALIVRLGNLHLGINYQEHLNNI